MLMQDAELFCGFLRNHRRQRWCMVGDAHDAEAAVALAHVRQVHEECAVVGVDAAVHRVCVDARRLQVRCANVRDQSRGELRRESRRTSSRIWTSESLRRWKLLNGLAAVWIMRDCSLRRGWLLVMWQT